MTDANETDNTTGFKTALDSHIAVASLRRHGLSDGAVEFIEEASAPLFNRMLAAPCASLSEVVRKGEAILDEYGEGPIAPEMVAALVADVRRLVQ